MEQRNEGMRHSAKFLRQRKFLLVLPIIILPFSILLLWTVGLVGSAKGENRSQNKLQGLNLSLPNAAPAKDSAWNKLKYYEQADKDSAKLRSLLKSNPFRYSELEAVDIGQNSTVDKNNRNPYDPYPVEKEQDVNERRVYSKLAELNRRLDHVGNDGTQREQPKSAFKRDPALPSSDVDRLENMMRSMEQPAGEDTEMKQYNDILDKILDIQNPQRVQEQLREQSQAHKRQVFRVEQQEENKISVLQAKADFREQLQQYQSDSIPKALQLYSERNRFYSLEEQASELSGQRCIRAVVHESQTLVSGTSIRLRLQEDIYIAGARIPKGEFMDGIAALNGERLSIAISSVEYKDLILPVALTVYDKKDGLPGIHITDAITRDAAKRSATQAMQGVGAISTADASIAAQAVNAGIQAAQSLVTKATKLVRVTVGAGYPVLLKDDNQKDN